MNGPSLPVGLAAARPLVAHGEKSRVLESGTSVVAGVGSSRVCSRRGHEGPLRQLGGEPAPTAEYSLSEAPRRRQRLMVCGVVPSSW